MTNNDDDSADHGKYNHSDSVDADDLRLLYNDMASHLLFLKNKQWTISYYGGIAFATMGGFLYFLLKTPFELSYSEKGILFFVLGAVFIFVSSVAVNIHKQIRRRKMWVNMVISEMKPRTRSLIDELGKVYPESDESMRDYRRFNLGYTVASLFPSLLGGLFCIWILVSF